MSRESGGLFSWLHISYRLLASTSDALRGRSQSDPHPPGCPVHAAPLLGTLGILVGSSH